MNNYSSGDDGALKAVLFADFFSDQLRPPCTDETFCEALLPIANVCLIQYQLEALLLAQVKECIIICRESVKETLSKFVETLKLDMNLHFLASSQWLVAGDAIRELDSRGDLRPQSDFILLLPGAFFTFNLAEVVKAHRTRREKNKNWVVTCCFGQRSISCSCDIARLEDGQIIQYSSARKGKLVVPGIMNMTDYCSRIEIFSNLEDCGIDICAPELLVEFRENFDYDNIRDFIRGKTDGGEGELLGNRIYGHILSASTDFACRLTNMESYFFVCFGFVHRWSYPWTVEQFPFHTTNYEYRRGPKYIPSVCTLARSSHIGRCTVLGENTCVDENAVVIHSIIGDNVKIGPNCHVRDSIIWSNSILKSRVSVCQSLIADGVVLDDDCVVSKGSIVGPSVLVDCKTHMPKNSRLVRSNLLSLSNEMEDLNIDSSVAVSREKQVGNASSYSLWQETLDETAQQQDSESSVDELEQIDRKESEDIAVVENREEVSATPDSLSFKSSSSSSPPMERKVALQEIKDTFQRALDEQHPPETAVLELNALKLALDIHSSLILRVIFPLLLDKLGVQGNTSQVTQQWITFFRYWSGVLIKFCPHSLDGKWILKYWKEYCERRTSYQKYFSFLVQLLYDCDVLSEEWIVEWYLEQVKSNPHSVWIQQLGTFVEWLQEAEETSSESEA